MKTVAEQGLAARALAKRTQRSQQQIRDAQQGIEKARRAAEAARRTP